MKKFYAKGKLSIPFEKWLFRNVSSILKLSYYVKLMDDIVLCFFNYYINKLIY